MKRFVYTFFIEGTLNEIKVHWNHECFPDATRWFSGPRGATAETEVTAGARTIDGISE